MARRAYHELNLDISELHNEVKQGTLDIPLHSFTQYLNTVLFPNAQNEKFNQNQVDALHTKLLRQTGSKCISLINENYLSKRREKLDNNKAQCVRIYRLKMCKKT